MAFTSEQIRARFRELERQTVPFLDGQVVLREIGAKERVALFGIVKNQDGEQSQASVLNLSCALLAKCAVDESGVPLMSADEWEKLADAELAAVMKLGVAALNLNKMTKENAESDAKNFESSQS